jgi:predicted enzyme related to lactoylglutathione lyase
MILPKVVHCEIPADDLDLARAFYGSVLGWHFDTLPMASGEYTEVVTRPMDAQTQLPSSRTRSTAA